MRLRHGAGPTGASAGHRRQTLPASSAGWAEDLYVRAATVLAHPQNGVCKLWRTPADLTGSVTVSRISDSAVQRSYAAVAVPAPRQDGGSSDRSDRTRV